MKPVKKVSKASTGSGEALEVNISTPRVDDRQHVFGLLVWIIVS
jgi:hypothetical protein